MKFVSDLIDINLDPTVIAGLIGILSMVVARLLDWYFPQKHHRKLDDDQSEETDEEDTK